MLDKLCKWAAEAGNGDDFVMSRKIEISEIFPTARYSFPLFSGFLVF